MDGFFLILPLAVIIITGNLLRARGFYDAKDISVLSKTLYWVILPPLLFRTTYVSGRELLTQPNLFFATTFCYIVTIAVAWYAGARFVHKGNRKRYALSAMASMRSNNMYIGLPVVHLAMGETGFRYASIYIAVSMIVFQLSSLLAGEMAMSGKLSRAGAKKIAVKVLKNPLIISCVAGLAATMAGIPMPKFLDEAMRLMSNAATAVALIALGGTLDFSSAGKIARSIAETWFDCFIKLVFHPIVMYLSLLIWPVPADMVKVSVMLTVMPTAVNVFIMSKEMEMDEEYGANLVAATMVLSVFFIPLWAYVMKL